MSMTSVVRNFHKISFCVTASPIGIGKCNGFGGLNANSSFGCYSQLLLRWKSYDRRELIDSTPKKDMGTQGEKSLDIDLMSRNKADMFPDENTPNLLFDGVRFAELPVCHIKATKNNTHVHVVTVKGEELAFKTCGREGFKNARKGTNIAAQATALSVSSILKEKGVKNLRVKIQGIGPGRMSSVKGLQMGGMTIISLTDSTPISFNPPRPRKARRL